jgi:hypothetical protein
MGVEIFKIATPTYKVFTALLTQPSGDYDTFYQSDGSLTIGQTYFINNNIVGADFLNVGAPNNNDGTFFIATGTTPTTWGTGTPEDTLSYFTGTPIVTILENTLGYLWVHYNGAGNFEINRDNQFNVIKSYYQCSKATSSVFIGANFEDVGNYPLNIYSRDLLNEGIDGVLYYAPIEIRVYN